MIGNPVGGVAEIIPLEQSIYAFDADSITNCFPDYSRVMSVTGYARPDERVIAPIPDKTEGLKQDFIRHTYEKAKALVRQTGTLIAIGYSFNVHDHVSYKPILDALAETSNRTLFIVSPGATSLAARLSAEHARIKINPIERTFKEWAANSFEMKLVSSVSKAR